MILVLFLRLLNFLSRVFYLELKSNHTEELPCTKNSWQTLDVAEYVLGNTNCPLGQVDCGWLRKKRALRWFLVRFWAQKNVRKKIILQLICHEKPKYAF